MGSIGMAAALITPYSVPEVKIKQQRAIKAASRIYVSELFALYSQSDA